MGKEKKNERNLLNTIKSFPTIGLCMDSINFHTYIVVKAVTDVLPLPWRIDFFHVKIFILSLGCQIKTKKNINLTKIFEFEFNFYFSFSCCGLLFSSQSMWNAVAVAMMWWKIHTPAQALTTDTHHKHIKNRVSFSRLHKCKKMPECWRAHGNSQSCRVISAAAAVASHTATAIFLLGNLNLVAMQTYRFCVRLPFEKLTTQSLRSYMVTNIHTHFYKLYPYRL